MALALLLAVSFLAAAPAGPAHYAVATIAGEGDCGDGGPASLARLGAPEGLAADSAGNLYVSDALDHRVRKISSSGVVSTVAGTGRPGFRGDGGPAAASRLNAPYGLALDAAGNLYIADLGNARVRQVSPDGVIRTIPGGSDGVRLNQPRNLALDAAGNLYISDFGDHSVYRLTADGVMSRIAGTGRAGSVEDDATVEAALAPLRSPAGLAVDRAGALYIADSGNHSIRKVQNGILTTVRSAHARLDTPTGLALDSSGNLYVADKGMSMVWKLTPVPVRVAPLAEFNEPRELAFDSFGNLYVAEKNASAGIVRRVLPSGAVTAFAGGEPIHPPGDDGPAISAYLEAPSGLALDASGALYVAERSGHRVRRISSGTITTVAGIGFPGSGGDGGFAVRAQLDQPENIAMGAAGGLWITEPQAGRIRQVDETGRIFTLSADASSFPGGVATDAGGNAYVADASHHVVRKLTPDGHGTVYAGTGLPGYAGDGGPAASALLRSPAGLFLDSTGNLYIADSGNHAVRKVAPGGAITTVAGRGESWFGGDGGPATGAWLNMPSAVAADAQGNLFIADTGNRRVRRVDTRGIIDTIAGPDDFDEPAGIVVDPEGVVYVADRVGLVRKLTPAPLPPPEIEDPPKEEPPELTVTSLVNAASMLPGPVAPGGIATLYGTALDSAHVLLDGEPAALLYVGARQVNFVVPRMVAGRASAEVEVRTPAASLRLMVPVADANPGIFTLAAGTGQAAAENEDGTRNSAESPVLRGTVLTLYATGEGAGTAIVEIGGEPASIVSAEHAAGVLRVGVRVPASCPPGQNRISLTSAGARTQPGVTAAVR